MLIELIILLSFVIFSSILQKNYKIPTPVTLMLGVLILMYFNINIYKISDTQFDNLVLLSLPLLITSDALKLKYKDLKENGFSLFWVAVVAVALSILVGVYMNKYVLIDYTLSIASVVLLFSMICATDPITVSAIFSNFKVPHKLKVLTEGESLFNDATALIIFSIGLILFSGNTEITTGYIISKSFSVIVGALGVGLLIGYITIFALKLSDDAFVEAAIILLASYTSYILAEHYHFSGILAVIVSVVISNQLIQKNIENSNNGILKATEYLNFGLLKYSITNKDNQQTILKSIDFASMFVSAILFISIASVANLDKLIHYKYEIISVFIASTIIRAIMMLKFAVLSNKVSFMHSIKLHWWAVLTFAGSKGAISILMVHMIPASFEYKELFENIIIGNIFLSTFVYSVILAIIITKNKLKFENEVLDEEVNH